LSTAGKDSVDDWNGETQLQLLTESLVEIAYGRPKLSPPLCAITVGESVID
jgi:hypothetical protein